MKKFNMWYLSNFPHSYEQKDPFGKSLQILCAYEQMIYRRGTWLIHSQFPTIYHRIVRLFLSLNNHHAVLASTWEIELAGILRDTAKRLVEAKMVKHQTKVYDYLQQPFTHTRLDREALIAIFEVITEICQERLTQQGIALAN